LAVLLRVDLVLSVCEGWDVEVDVLVVGAGGGGLCAAVRAAETGDFRVTVIEKRGLIGGNTVIAGGRMNVAGTVQQERLGIEDSVDLHYAQTRTGGDFVADPELVWVLTSGAKDALDYLESHGMKFRGDDVSAGIGGIWPRGIMGVEPRGKGYVNAWKRAAESLGVEILLNTRMTAIVREGLLSGRVLGVRAVNDSGRELAFKAECVIVATGGFAGDVGFRVKHDHRWTGEFPSSNYPGVTGEGLMMVADVGGDLVGMDYIQLLPHPYDLAMQRATTRVTQVIADQIYVNRAGERVVNSDARRDQLRDALYAQEGHMGFQLCDEGGRQRAKDTYPYRFVGDREIEASVENGTLFRGGSVQEVAERAGIDSEGLVETVARYNEYVDLGRDDEWGKNPAFLTNRFEEPPFYVWRVAPRAHHTMGGVRIDREARVLDRWGEVIPGLYAVGEVTGGIHGANRVGGNALLEIHVFGIIAGENAAKEALDR
jgi:flavocytochrome c